MEDNIQKNVFTKGINKDIDVKFVSNEIYLDAHNIRLMNDVAGTGMSVNNIAGNSLNISIPDLCPITKVITNGDFTISSQSINSQTATLTTVGNTTISDIYNFIISNTAFTKCVQNPNYVNSGDNYNIYLNDLYILLMPVIGDTCTLVVNTSDSNTLASELVAAQSNLEIIGSADIRGDIYLFTTNNTTKSPGKDDPSSVGQIWKYTYNKITNIGALELKYNNYVDFSTYNAIAPSAALGRYENASIQRIYWTDNFNKLRSLNVANINSMALDVSVLDVIPAVDFDIPILTNIQNSGGTNFQTTSVINAVYRLKNTTGATTSFSEVSNNVFIVPNDELSQTPDGWRQYIGGPINTGCDKIVEWTINNIDRDFDRIEALIIIREVLTGVVQLVLLPDAPVSEDSYTFTYEGNEQSTTISIEEFEAISGVFTHCKTIATKDNRLFVGNIRNELGDVPLDTRVYRFDNTQHAIINDGNGNQEADINGAAPTYPSIETLDAINPNQDVYKYRADGTTLGGDGPNISYEFYTIASRCDSTFDATNGNYSLSNNQGSPWRIPRQEFGTVSLTAITDLTLNVVSPTNQGTDSLQEYSKVYNFGQLRGGFKYPDITGVLKGYQRNETYRFGIQFYDKSKNPYFVKWIGDIKMPDFWDVNNNAFFEDGSPCLYSDNITPVTDFRHVFNGPRVNFGRPEAYVQSLGIKFNIDIPESLQSKIDGYSIVRVERTNDDKHVVTEGLITPTVVSTSDGQCYMPSLFDTRAGNGADPFGNSTRLTDRMFFVTPDINDRSNLKSPGDGMKLVVRAVLQQSNTTNELSTGGATPFNYIKYYDFIQTHQDLTILNQYELSYGESRNVGTHVINNFDFDTDGNNTNVSRGIGNSCDYFTLNGTNISYYAISASNSQLFATVETTPSNPYGGNTYTARSNNEYMSCSHFRPIRIKGALIQDSFICYGGDVFVNLYDDCRMAKNREESSSRSNGGLNQYSVTFFFPTATSINTELRDGRSMNKDFVGGAGYEVEFNQNYQYNAVYSAENNIKTYFPKPDPFITNDEFDNRFYASDIKINGELTDSWGLYNSVNYWDVEGTYGPINAAIILRDKLYFFQNRAFGLMEVNPRAVVTDVNNTSNSELQLGTGLPLQRHDYISTEVGLQHQWGLTQSSYKLYWSDVANKKFFSYSSGQAITPESDIKGMFSFFTNNLISSILTTDKPVYNSGIGVRAVYDYKYNQAIFTFIDGDGGEYSNKYTLAFDDAINAFTSFYSYTPKIYFTDGYKIFSTNNDLLSDIYMHDVGEMCTFYGKKYNSNIKFAINKYSEITKTFDNLKMDLQSMSIDGANQATDFLTTYRAYTDYQNSDFQPLILNTNYKRKERTFQLFVPRNRVINTPTSSVDIFNPINLSPTNKPFGDRMRDKFLVVDLIYNNSTGNKITINNVISEFRKSAR